MTIVYLWIFDNIPLASELSHKTTCRDWNHVEHSWNEDKKMQNASAEYQRVFVATIEVIKKFESRIKEHQNGPQG